MLTAPSPNQSPRRHGLSSTLPLSSWLLASVITGNLLALALPLAVLQLYDRILPHQSHATLLMLAGGVAVALLLEAVLRFARGWCVSWLAYRTEQQAAQQAMATVLTRKASALARHPWTDFTKLGRIADSWSAQQQWRMVDMPFALLFLALIAVIGGHLVWLVLAWIAVTAATLVWLLQRQTLLQARKNAGETRQVRLLRNSLLAMPTIKATGYETALYEQFLRHQQPQTKRVYQLALTQQAIQHLLHLWPSFAVAIVVIAGAHQLAQQALSIGALVALVLLTGRLATPLQQTVLMLNKWLEDRRLQRDITRLTRLPACQPLHHATNDDIPDTPPVVTIASTPNSPLQWQGSLRFPPFTTTGLLLEPHQRKALFEAISGQNSTPLYQAAIGHMAAETIPATQRIHQIAWLSSDMAIFRGTLLDNITGFRPEYTHQAQEIARLLGIDTAMAGMAQGYATHIDGQQADTIPPGLKQRLALARALLFRPKIILVDDADRGLDIDGYNHLFQLLGRLKGKATLIFACDDQNIMRLANVFYQQQGNTLVQMKHPPHGSMLPNYRYRELPL